MFDRSAMLGCLPVLVRPLVRFCLRHSIKLQDFLECTKLAFIAEARAQIADSNSQITDSRISVMTGVHRRDITRLKSEKADFDSSADIITRVIGQWQNDKRFSKAGAARALTFGSQKSEFHRLVRSVSKENNPSTIMFELERVGAVKFENEKVHLVLQLYVPKGDIRSAMKILADDGDDLIGCVEENIIGMEKLPNSHLRTVYDRIRLPAVPQIKAWLLKECHDLHSRAREFISQFDQDINPDLNYNGLTGKVILGSFSKTHATKATEDKREMQ